MAAARPGRMIKAEKGVGMTDLIAANWIWIVFVGLMVAMHRHGGCGAHGHRHASPERDTDHAHQGGRSTS